MTKDASFVINRYPASRGLWWWIISFIEIMKQPFHWFSVGVAITFILIVAGIIVGLINSMIFPFVPVLVYFIEAKSLIQFFDNDFYFAFQALLPNIIAGISVARKAQEKNVITHITRFFEGFGCRFFTLLSIGVLSIVLPSLINFDTIEFSNSKDGMYAIYNFIAPLCLGLCKAILIFLIIFLPSMVVVFQRVGFLRAIARGLRGSFMNFGSILVLILILAFIFICFLVLGSIIPEKNSALLYILNLFALFLLCCGGVSAFNAYHDIFQERSMSFIAWR